MFMAECPSDLIKSLDNCFSNHNEVTFFILHEANNLGLLLCCNILWFHVTSI